MTIHTIKASAWLTIRDQTCSISTPIEGTEVERSIDIDSLRDATVKKALGEVAFDVLALCVGKGRNIMDASVNFRISIMEKKQVSETGKIY